MKKVTFDLQKSWRTLKAIIKTIGTVEKDVFEKSWKEAFTLEEAKTETMRRTKLSWKI